MATFAFTKIDVDREGYFHYLYETQIGCSNFGDALATYCENEDTRDFNWAISQTESLWR